MADEVDTGRSPPDAKRRPPEGPTLDLIYQRITEKKIDAELRVLLDDEASA